MDYEQAQGLGYPEEYMTWYYGTYKPLVGEDAVGLDNGIHIWRMQKEQEMMKREEQGMEEPGALGVADDIMLQGKSLAQTNEDLNRWRWHKYSVERDAERSLQPIG